MEDWMIIGFLLLVLVGVPLGLLTLLFFSLRMAIRGLRRGDKDDMVTGIIVSTFLLAVCIYIFYFLFFDTYLFHTLL